MKQLADQDASFLCLETPESPMHMGGLSLIELPAAYPAAQHAKASKMPRTLGKPAAEHPKRAGAAIAASAV